MSFFGNIVSDLSELGSNKKKFKKQLTSLVKLLADYSFGDMPYSKELGKQKIIVAYNELIEFSQILDKNEIIKVYFKNKDVDLSIETAIKIADFLTQAILEELEKLTNSFIAFAIEKFNNENQVFQVNSNNSDKLKNKFPALLFFIKEFSAMTKGVCISIDTSDKYEFMFPVYADGLIGGYNYYGIKRIENLNFGLYCFMTSVDKKQRIDASLKIIENDIESDEYYNYFSEMVNEIGIKSLSMNF